MAHDDSLISFPFTHRVNVFGLALFVINGTSKAQCDTFLRIWVCQGHINIINEEDANWREAETQKKGEEAQGRKHLFLSVKWCILTCGLNDDCLCKAALSDEEKVAPRDLVRLPTIGLVHMGANGWQHPFFSNSIWKNHIFLCSFMASGKELGSIQRKLLSSWRQLYLSEYVALFWA